MKTVARPTVSLRTYRDEDEPAVLELLEASLGGGPAGRRPPAFFRWKHLDNPFGRSYMLLAEADDRLVGFRSFMRWRFEAGGQAVRAVRAVDTATHPDYQGLGIFRRLTTTAIEDLRAQADLIFNTPNDRSLPGYLKMGWRRVAEVPIKVRVRRPVRFVMHLRSRHEPAASPQTLEETPTRGGWPWAEAAALARGNGPRLATVKDEAYLRWRYDGPPLLSYRVAEEREGDRLRGIAVYRIRPRGRLREATVVDVLVSREDRACASRLLRRVARGNDVDHLTSSFPAGSVQASAARRAGFLPSPEGMTLVANPLADLPRDVFSLGAWSLTLGDLEVF